MPRAALPLVAPFTVVVDTREQRPYAFAGLIADADRGNRPLAVPIKLATLATGDYSIVGLESRVCVERKSRADLFSSIAQGRANFERRLERMQAMQAAFVVVESSWLGILTDPPPHSQLPPKNVYRTVQSWMLRFSRVHWVMMDRRDLAEQSTFRLLEKFWKVHAARKYAARLAVKAMGA